MFSKSCSRRRHKLEVGPIETTTIGGEIIFIALKTKTDFGCSNTLVAWPQPLIPATATVTDSTGPSNIEHELSREVALRAA